MRFGRLMLGLICGGLLLCSGAAAAPVAARPATLSLWADGRQVQLHLYDGALGWQLAFSSLEEMEEVPLAREPEPHQAQRDQIVRLSNQLRRQAGVPALDVDPLLSQAAQVRAEEMAASSCYSHTRPDGRAANTVTDCPYTGENIHRLSDAYLAYAGVDVVQAAIGTWAGSDAHRDNILLDRYGSFGVGLARGTDASGQDCWYCVQIFLLEGQAVTRVDGPAVR